jgi:hypothetical protein
MPDNARGLDVFPYFDSSIRHIPAKVPARAIAFEDNRSSLNSSPPTRNETTIQLALSVEIAAISEP